MARTKIRHEWAYVPVGHVKMHVWIEYPDGDGKAPVVWSCRTWEALRIGLAVSRTNWQCRAHRSGARYRSGLGPNRGNYDSFKFPDDVIKAAARLSGTEAMRRYKAAREYAMHLPRPTARVRALVSTRAARIASGSLRKSRNSMQPWCSMAYRQTQPR